MPLHYPPSQPLNQQLVCVASSHSYRLKARCVKATTAATSTELLYLSPLLLSC
jgi:hypothetical protein